MAAIEIDSTNNRLWLIRFPEVWDGEHYKSMLLETIERNPSGLRYAAIIDMRQSSRSGIPSEARTIIGSVMKEHGDWNAQTIVCSVRVTTNAILRGTLTVYDWDLSVPWPRRTVATGSLAESWARAKLAAEGIACASEAVWRP